jgi:hypothetical protein
LKPQPAPNRFFNDPNAFDCAESLVRQFRPGKRLPQLLHRGIMTSFDPPKPLMLLRGNLGSPHGVRRARIDRMILCLALRRFPVL